MDNRSEKIKSNPYLNDNMANTDFQKFLFLKANETFKNNLNTFHK